MSHRVLNIVPCYNSFVFKQGSTCIQGERGLLMGSYSCASVISTLTTKAEASQVVSITSDVREKPLQGDDTVIRGLSV